MFTAGLVLSIFLSAVNAGNLYQQSRLTRMGSTAPTVPENVHYSDRHTYETVPKPVGYYPPDSQRSNIDRTFRSPSNGDQHNHQDFHNHNHNHNYDQPDLSGQIYADRRNNYPQIMPNTDSTYRISHTTERYYRDAQPISNSNGSFPYNSYVNRATKPKGMIFPSEQELSKVFGTPSPPQSPLRPLDVRAPSTNCSYGLCDNVVDYPEDKILKIIQNSRDLKQYFTNIAGNIPDFILNRFGDDENTLCSTMVHTQFPRSAQNIDNEEKLLVNVGDYKQGIVFETCANEGKPCKYSEDFPNDITTFCKQKYTVRRLMAVQKESDEAVFDNFHLPSCCVCVTKKN